MRRTRPVLVETLFADPVWLCSVGLGCCCDGTGCSADRPTAGLNSIPARNQTKEMNHA